MNHMTIMNIIKWFLFACLQFIVYDLSFIWLWAQCGITHSYFQHLTDSHPPYLFTTQKNCVVASTKTLFKINRSVFIVVIQSCVNWD